MFFEQAIWFERKVDAYGLKNYVRDLAERRDPGVPSRLRAGNFGMSQCEAVFAGPAYPAGKVPVAPCSGCSLEFFREDLNVCSLLADLKVHAGVGAIRINACHVVGIRTARGMSCKVCEPAADAQGHVTDSWGSVLRNANEHLYAALICCPSLRLSVTLAHWQYGRSGCSDLGRTASDRPTGQHQ